MKRRDGPGISSVKPVVILIKQFMFQTETSEGISRHGTVSV